MIPNNKIRPWTIPNNLKARAQQIAQDMGGFAVDASDLIEYQEFLANTMKYVFGGAFICSTTAIAKKVAFDRAMGRKYRTINMEGDITDPKGTLTGGFFNNQNLWLTKYSQFQNVRFKFQSKFPRFLCFRAEQAF